ncbi:hypothetical protein BDW66DRAFT_157944 [Aspergillus desertorum]
MERARLYERHRFAIFQLFVTEDLTRGQAKLQFERQDAVRAKAILDQAPEGGHCLVFADGVLQENEKLIRHYHRINDPITFKNFQYLLFTTRVHFESCFDTGEWGPDHNGLYARSPELKAQLVDLSKLHNKVFRALKQLEQNNDGRARELLKSASDILGILLMVQRAGKERLQQSIAADLVSLAREDLSLNDPRRLMFECLEKLDFDQLCPIYLAFDAYCRSLWMKRAGDDYIKAYFSYNQARFPRADAGEFYSLYRGRTVVGIEHILSRVDMELGRYSHETMTLWHTAMEYLWSEGQYVEMGYICHRLSGRLQHWRGLDYVQDPQLNHDVSTTFLLDGLAQEAQRCPYTARLSFQQAAQARNIIIPDDQWDPAREGALSKLVEVDRQIGRVHSASYSSMLIDKMYTAK